jgi:dipeptidyl aminopeptidase/acylaminoacyl peptidase
MKMRALLLCSLLLLVPGLAAAEKPAGDEKKWTVEDILLTEQALDFQLSPDGRWAVWVKRQMDKEKGERITNLFLSSLTEKKEIQLTRGPFTHTQPRWSPDGALISFLSTRPLPDTVMKKDDLHKSQLWLIRPEGGEPWHLTELERGVASYGWKDKDTLIIAAQEDPALYEQQVKERKDTSQVIEDAPHEPPVRLFALSVKDRKLKRLIDNADWIDAVAVSPDGRWAVARHQVSLSFEFDNRVPPELSLVNLESGKRAPVETAQERALPLAIEWARDSGGFYIRYAHSSHPQYFTATVQRLSYFDLSSRQTLPVPLDWARGLADEGRVLATPDGFLALLANGVRHRAARYTRAGEKWTRSWLGGEHTSNIFHWALGADGRTLVYEYSTASQPAQWYRARLEAAQVAQPAQLTDLNPNFKDKPVYKTEIVRWQGARDEEVEGILYYPVNYEEGKRYPLILAIHGGPAGADFDTWEQSYAYPKILLAQKGAFQLEINYHGSSSYGLEWVESIGDGNYYDLERVDFERGVDFLIARGLADPDKLATMGWSNGAILSIDLAAHNPRYKVLSAGAGNIEFFGDWGLVEFSGAWDGFYFGKQPYEAPELYTRKSPYFRLKDVRTPTILYTGTDDRAVGPINAWNHFRILQMEAKAPVKFVLFPGEPHGLARFVHQQRKVGEDLEWFDRYLFETYKAPNEAFKEGSPLDVALKRGRVQKVGTNYGVAVKARLIPEVVNHKGLELGRFEVTRAQFAAFDRSYRVAPGTENFPANGVAFERAQAYATWLARLTGQSYRLANESEVSEFYAGATGNENTLDFWAGYAPNPDDAARLAEKIKELSGAAPLLREVGQFQGIGEEELVFDLGGNVAEWVIGPDGKGKLVGGSADRPADPKARPQDAAEAYRGFRIVRGEPKPTDSRAN